MGHMNGGENTTAACQQRLRHGLGVPKIAVQALQQFVVPQILNVLHQVAYPMGQTATHHQ